MQERATREEPSRGVHRIDGYLPIEDYAAVGDRSTVALIGRDGSLDWLCWPRYDSAFPFGALLDSDRGGRFAIAPDHEFEASRAYAPLTNVLETTFVASDGSARLTDAMSLDGDGQPLGELIRVVEALDGQPLLRWRCAPRLDRTRRPTWRRTRDERFLAAHEGEGVALQLLGAEAPRVLEDGLQGELRLQPGQRATFVLTPAGAGDRQAPALTEEQARGRIDQTASWWRGFAQRCAYPGPWREEVLRSGLALKLLVDSASGAIVAAPTTSLPEALGGSRNWDYRYCWLRDASFSIDALLRLGDEQEAARYFRWLIGASRGEGERLRPFYRLDGSADIEERQRHDLAGYRESRPVLEGNGAVSQRQLGNYGDVLQAAALYAARGHGFEEDESRRLAQLADHVCEVWAERDSGIWELGEHLHYTTSKMLCWVALDRALQLASEGAIPGASARRWEAGRDQIGDFVEERCWSERMRAYSRSADSDELDAAVALACVLGYDAPQARMSATLDALARELGAGPFTYRYSGMQGQEGAFLACSFWRAHALAHGGRLDEAEELVEALLAHANDVGLYSEQLDPPSGALLGNFPQALTHVAFINAAAAIGAARQQG